MAEKITRPKVAKLKTAGFTGRVVKFPGDALTTLSGMKSAREIVFPGSRTDVATAITRLQNEKVFVRSGTQAAAASDVADAAGGIVINLAGLNSLAIRNGVASAEAGATSGQMTELLRTQDLALPFPDNPHQSIGSAVLNEEPACLMRTLGPLSGYVSRLSSVAPDGKAITRSGTSALALSRESKGIITGVTFRPASATNLWMSRRSFPYPGKDVFTTLARALFLNTQIPLKSDLVLDAFSARHDLPMVRITAAGSALPDEATLTKLVDSALAGLPRDFADEIITEHYSGSAVIKSIADAGFGIPADPAVDTHRVHQILGPDADAGEFLGRVAEDVHRGLAFQDDGTGKIDKQLRLFTRIQLNGENHLELSGFVYTPRVVPSAAPRVVLSAVPSSFPPGLASLTSVTRTAVAVSLSPALFEAPAPRIPGFKGEVYIPTDLTFEWHATQYATSSFPKAGMTPFMVAYPLDEADLQAAIRFARAEHKRIVARSGGHQYTGKSSGDLSTIVLSMDEFNQFVDITGNIVEVGPAIRLSELADGFRQRGITIPHGECPLVCIGGHAQTGGFGHLLRSFGLALDHVTAFTIMLADGTVRTVQRPAGAPVTDDEKLFWGVLGGNAGSFGIVINYRIECIRDADHPNSYGYAATRKYQTARYRSLMNQVQTWTQGVQAGTQPAGIDFTMTVESAAEPFLPPLLLVEMVHSNPGGKGEPVNGDAVFQPIIQASDTGAGWWTLLTTSGPASLSTLSDSFVRRFPKTTWDGREFRYPYKKRVNCTIHALTKGFLDKFVGLVETAVNTNGVYLVFQMMIGGGDYRNSTLRPGTSIPQRDFVFCFVFDIFYDDGSEQKAEGLQHEMQIIVDTELGQSQERRLFWGSFGDTDMTKPAVVNLYYDDTAKYVVLQALKKQVDPEDIFHTAFTVQLP